VAHKPATDYVMQGIRAAVPDLKIRIAVFLQYRYTENMRITLTMTERGTITLPRKLRDILGIKPDDQLIAEPTAEGLLLRPAMTFPVETYSQERIIEFDAAEADLANYLSTQTGN
jgi:antitoxin PrlF